MPNLVLTMFVAVVTVPLQGVDNQMTSAPNHVNDRSV